MPIVAVCPRCQATGPVGAYLADAQVRTAWDLLAARWSRWPGLLVRVLPYLDLHAPAEHRVHPPKLVRLLHDLGDLIDRGQATRDGHQVPLHPGHWALAMDAAQEARAAGTLRLPLPDGFGWLAAVAATIATDPTRTASAAALRDGPGDLRPQFGAGKSPLLTPTADADADLRELTADLQHWARMAALSPASAQVFERLQARYLEITGRPWGTAGEEAA